MISLISMTYVHELLFLKVCMRDEVRLENGGTFNYHMNMLRISVVYQERFEEFIKIRTMFLIIALILVYA